MKHLTQFSTQNDYNSAKDNLAVPNVSYISGDNKVVYKAVTPSGGGSNN